MAEIYIRDDLYARDSTISRVSSEGIKRVLYDVRSAIPVEVKQVARGYIVKYRSDAQVNYIMQNSIYSQLQARNLTPDLTNDARYHRELLVPDVPESLYELQKEVLLSELEHQNSIKILQITPFSPR